MVFAMLDTLFSLLLKKSGNRETIPINYRIFVEFYRDRCPIECANKQVNLIL